ncbi:hypothetical protein [Candidatus Tisiphia endosymbiont of Hybos culiciformis]|uniref:hypothetical protein n=1 Tax=Candidatus Tisiphia endosymbiont of Hybos culiciformis TaxID=3139331 RepID=UPI003CCAE198
MRFLVIELTRASIIPSLREATSVATKQSIKATKNGLLRRHKVAPRNDVSLL